MAEWIKSQTNLFAMYKKHTSPKNKTKQNDQKKKKAKVKTWKKIFQTIGK